MATQENPKAGTSSLAENTGKAGLGGRFPPSEAEEKPAVEAASGVGRRLALIAPAIGAHDHAGQVATGFQVVAERAGFIKVKNPVLYRKNSLCQAIERKLMGALGVDRYQTHSIQCMVQVEYDPRRLTRHQIIEILDGALANAEHPAELDDLDLDIAICAGSLALAGIAQFAAPALLPVAAAVFAYTALPTFQGASEMLFKEKRLGVDFLDSIVVLGCLRTLKIFSGAVMALCLSFGRMLVKKTQGDSKKLLLNAFGKQPRFAWLLRDCVEIEVSLDEVNAGDIVVAYTGDSVPVDGHVLEGTAMVDQQVLTGESIPVEKGLGDRVFASTIVVAGKIYISVEKAGSETASAKISQILNDTAGYKLASQSKSERLADAAVTPTMAVGALAYAALGPQASVAVLNSDFGTGIRMAAPLAMLSTLALCAQKGILVKDGRALELMGEIDTVLFDKTGTLTRERPEVGRIIAANGFGEEEILLFAATAEQKFHHPIAMAILHKAGEMGIALAKTDETQYKAGYGISVVIGGHTVRVGSQRYLEMEGIPITPEVQAALDEAHLEGFTLVMVGVDDQLGGALELQASVRPEVRGIVNGLRQRGIKHLAIISGDHEAPTAKLAKELGMDRYFAQVLPADKAEYVKKLQQEGRKVCFVGDGINDSIALKQANVSISLRGASSIATDTAQIVFMEQGLDKLCELRDLAQAMERNVRNSWKMIIVPNVVCVAGVFTLGFGIGASVVTNNVAALGALANGVWPMRKVAQLEAGRRQRLEAELKLAGYGVDGAIDASPSRVEEPQVSL